VQARGTLPLTEAEAVVRSLSIAMHGGRQIVIPLLQLKEFDQVHDRPTVNVAVPSDGPRRSRGLSSRDVPAFGVAGLLHDIGKVKIPLDVLTSRDGSRHGAALMNRHPAEGARIICAPRRTWTSPPWSPTRPHHVERRRFPRPIPPRLP